MYRTVKRRRTGDDGESAVGVSERNRGECGAVSLHGDVKLCWVSESLSLSWSVCRDLYQNWVDKEK